MTPMHEVNGSGDPVGRLVGGEPVSVGEKLTLRAAAAVLSADEIGAVLVRRPDGSSGIVSERDVVRALAGDADPDVVWSSDVMTPEVITVKWEEPILGVALLMIDEEIRHVVVVDEAGAAIGVVSARDIFRTLAEETLDSLP